MLRPRIIPCLLIREKGLVKTVKFSNPKYVGDPINAVRIFNEKEVDELIVLDIDATAENREPDFLMIQKLASECRMPFCYGGGVKTVDHAKKIISLGAEKVALSSVAVYDSAVIKSIANAVGNQSVVIVMDIKKYGVFRKYGQFTHNGQRKTGNKILEFAKQMEASGAGEIVINSIDRDGTMEGYDFELVDKIRSAVSIPITVLGGAGSLQDIGNMISRHGIIGVAAGSLFVFKGVYKAVLISYPSLEEKKKLFHE